MDTKNKPRNSSIAFINDKSPLIDFICNDLVISGTEVLFRSENVQEGLSQLSALTELPRAVIIDLELNDKHVLAQLKVLKSKYPTVKLILHSDKDDTQTITALLEMGIESYLLIGNGTDEFEKAIENVSNDKRYFSVGVSNIVENYFNHF